MFSNNTVSLLSWLSLFSVLIAGCGANKGSEESPQVSTTKASELCNTEGFNPFGTERRSLSSAERLKALRYLKTQSEGWKRLAPLKVSPTNPWNVANDPFITLVAAGLASGDCKGVNENSSTKSEISVTGAQCPIQLQLLSDPITSDPGEGISGGLHLHTAYADPSQARHYVSRTLDGRGRQIDRSDNDATDTTQCHTLVGRMETVDLGAVDVFIAQASQQHLPPFSDATRFSEYRSDVVFRRGYRSENGVMEIRLTEQSRGDHHTYELLINGEPVPDSEVSTVGTLSEIFEMLTIE